MKVPVLLLAAAFALGGCNALKTAKLLAGGSVRQKSFTATTPFVFDKLIRTKVLIHGKTYNFIFDTGAQVSVIAETAAKELGLKPYTSSKVGDSQGAKRALNFYRLDSVQIGGVAFTDQAFAGSDFSLMKCFGNEAFDGIIGATLMRRAVWLIDNEQNTLTLASERSRLKPLKNEQAVPFTTSKLDQVPYFILNIDGLVAKQKIELDLGSASAVTLNRKLVRNTQNHRVGYAVGGGSSGLFGKAKPDTTFTALVPKVEVGSVVLDAPQVVRFKRKGSSILGMAVLRNYNIVLDWGKQEFALAKVRNQVTSLTTKGFGITFEDGAFVVSALRHDSDAEKKGLKLGDKIVAINGQPYGDAANHCQAESEFNASEPPKMRVTVERDKQAVVLEIAATAY